MKCLVAVKRVVDYNIKVRVKTDGSDVDIEQVKKSINPFDEIALEAALQLKESGKLTEILAVSIGGAGTQETLRSALARGADRAIWVESNTVYEPLNIAKILKTIIQQESITFALLGKQAIDDDCNQTGQMLAGLLGWSQGTNISKIEIQPDQTLVVTREVDTGLETLALTLPAVVTTDLRLNEPRYVSLPNVMKAKNKPLSTIPVDSLALDIKAHVKTLKVEAPTMVRLGKILNTPKELVEKLRKEAKVLE